MLRRAVGQAPSALGCERIVLEASGGYEALVEEHWRPRVCRSQWSTPVRCATSRARSGSRRKTDPLDARVIALYAERVQPPLRQLPDAQTRALRELCVRREELIEMLVMERNRLRMASKATRHEIAGHVDYLLKRLHRMDRDLDQMVRNSPLWRERANR